MLHVPTDLTGDFEAPCHALDDFTDEEFNPLVPEISFKF
jgi:hypothetical protein